MSKSAEVVPTKERGEDSRFMKTQAIVAAEGNDYHTLWQSYAIDSPYIRQGSPTPHYTWTQESGVWMTIGHLAGHPICVCCMWLVIGGARILVWEVTSQVAHFEFARNWVEAQYPKGIPSVDAMNFHNAIHPLGDKVKMEMRQ